jgi:microcystin-dependent protein
VSSPFVAEIRIFACNFAPKGWAMCDGQLMPISQNTALFSLLGTAYGGDGKSTFGLPNLQGSSPMFWGQSSASGTTYFWGEAGGVPDITLLSSEIPVHVHDLWASSRPAALDTPSTQTALGRASPAIYKTATPTPPLQNLQIGAAPAPAGGGLPHNNMMPYLTFNFTIALQGVFPARS